MATEKQALNLFSTKDVAKLLGVDSTTVILWCRNGKLASYKTPGGHRRIKGSDLVSFLNKFNMPIPDKLKNLDQLTCLIVDDDKDIQRVIARVISSVDKSTSIQFASDGFEAGKKAIDFLPNLVVMDFQLPGLDGLKVCKELKTDPRFSNTKIIGISGQGGAGLKKSFLSAGANDFLPKPFKPTQLQSMVQNLLK